MLFDIIMFVLCIPGVFFLIRIAKISDILCKYSDDDFTLGIGLTVKYGCVFIYLTMLIELMYIIF